MSKWRAEVEAKAFNLTADSNRKTVVTVEDCLALVEKVKASVYNDCEQVLRSMIGGAEALKEVAPSDSHKNALVLAIWALRDAAQRAESQHNAQREEEP